MIYDGVLLEMKARLGTANKRTGVRSDSLSLTDLYQVLMYALFDHSDFYDIKSFAVYSARYGAFVSWPLADAFATMAVEPVDLQVERDRVWELLGG